MEALTKAVILLLEPRSNKFSLIFLFSTQNCQLFSFIFNIFKISSFFLSKLSSDPMLSFLHSSFLLQCGSSLVFFQASSIAFNCRVFSHKKINLSETPKRPKRPSRALIALRAESQHPHSCCRSARPRLDHHKEVQRQMPSAFIIFPEITQTYPLNMGIVFMWLSSFLVPH